VILELIGNGVYPGLLKNSVAVTPLPVANVVETDLKNVDIDPVCEANVVAIGLGLVETDDTVVPDWNLVSVVEIAKPAAAPDAFQLVCVAYTKDDPDALLNAVLFGTVTLAVVVFKAVAVDVGCATPPDQFTEPPGAICAKLGWPPAATPDSPLHIMSLGLAG
jgi:hypothetical protein